MTMTAQVAGLCCGLLDALSELFMMIPLGFAMRAAKYGRK
jgi:hypothetical protein